jgi:hypothetical protein
MFIFEDGNEDEPKWIFKLRQDNAKIIDEWNERGSSVTCSKI